MEMYDAATLTVKTKRTTLLKFQQTFKRICEVSTLCSRLDPTCPTLSGCHAHPPVLLFYFGHTACPCMSHEVHGA